MIDFILRSYSIDEADITRVSKTRNGRLGLYWKAFTLMVQERFISMLPLELMRIQWPTLRLLLGGFVQCSISIGFIYLLTVNYESSRDSKFLSFDPNAGECVNIRSSFSGTYYADSKGNWDTNTDYKVSMCIVNTPVRIWHIYACTINFSVYECWGGTSSRGS